MGSWEWDPKLCPWRTGMWHGDEVEVDEELAWKT